MRAFLRLLPALALLGACDETASPPPAATDTAPEPAPAGWSYEPASSGAAVWSSGTGDSVSFGCDAPAGALRVVRRGATSPQAGVVRVQTATGGSAQVTAAASGPGAIAGSLPLSDPAVSELAAATGPLQVTAGSQTLTTAPLTATLRRVIRDCRSAAAGAAPAVATSTGGAGATVTYQCLDGNEVTASYPDANSAVVIQAGRSYRMTRVPADRGTRYTGEGRQWWLTGRGLAATGSLGVLEPGETQAKEAGLLCKTKNPNAG